MLAQAGGGRSVSVGEACLASGAAPTTAIRRIKALEAIGAIRRLDDSADARRSLLHLTPSTERRLARYFGSPCAAAPKTAGPTPLRACAR